MFKSKEIKLIILGLIILLVEGIFFQRNLQNKNEAVKLRNEIKQQQRIDLAQKINSLSLEAKAVSIYDVEAKEFIYGQNDTLSLPFASLTKTMTVLIALEEKENSIDLLNLARFTLVSSSNEGADKLSLGIDNFILKMNEKAKKIGMENTIFYNPTGLDINENNAGAYGSAQDANILALYAFNLTNFFIRTTDLEADNVKNTDILLGKVSNILFSKTGYTELAGGNLTIIWKNKSNKKYAITVLGSSKEGRFSDMEKILNVL